MDTDHVLLPLVNYRSPASGAPRRSAARSAAETANYRAFSNFHQWEDVDGDGQIVIGAEQWPACLNPVTECANSSWMVVDDAFPLLPGDLGHHGRADLRDHQPGDRRADRRDALSRARAEPSNSDDCGAGRSAGPAVVSGTMGVPGKEGSCSGSSIRRLIWAVPTLLIVTFLVYVRDPHRHRPGRQLRARQRRGAGTRRRSTSTSRPTACTRGSAATSRLLHVARRLPHRRLAQQHQGQPRGVAQPQGRDGQLAALGRHRRHPRHHHRDHVRRVRRPEAGLAP